jgi:hypothetical protein
MFLKSIYDLEEYVHTVWRVQCVDKVERLGMDIGGRKRSDRSNRTCETEWTKPDGWN